MVPLIPEDQAVTLALETVWSFVSVSGSSPEVVEQRALMKVDS